MSNLPLSDVTNTQVAAYQEMVASLARRYDGWSGAEYDDLFQEGSLAIAQCLANGKLPSKDIVVRRMLNWVNKCARHGLGGYESLSERTELDALLN